MEGKALQIDGSRLREGKKEERIGHRGTETQRGLAMKGRR
jgi:hypothetical protein